MGLLDAPIKILGLTGRALGAGVRAALAELRGGDDAGAQAAPQAAQSAQPAPVATQQQRDEQAQEDVRRRQSSSAPKDFDDVTIARKVESRIFRGKTRHDLKAHIDVNAVDGVVYLRGVAKTPDLINTLEAETRAIPEVKGVENLLHLPHTPSPTRSDTPAAQRKTRRTPAKKPRTEPRRLNADKSSSEQGDAPEVLAREHRGRQPAPLGSHGDGSDTSSAPAPDDFTGRARSEGEDPVAGKGAGTEQPATTTTGTAGGPDGGGGEVVH
jgi:osmotically-inducible protein OsmY